MVCVIAYQFTLTSLVDFLREDAPLSFLPLLPPAAVALALAVARRHSHAKPPLRDRHVDLLLGIPLIFIALALTSLVPIIASAYYWSDRADVVSLTLFAAGATILVYGAAWFWRLKGAFILLFLAWPALYLRALGGLVQGFIDSTDAALAHFVSHLPLGVSLGGGTGIVIVHVPHAAALPVDVGMVSPTAGGMLGFAFIGGAILATVQGGVGRKLLWLADGVALVFAFGLLRIGVIVALAALGHPLLAKGAFHEFISPMVLAFAVVDMYLLLPRFGLRPKAAAPVGEPAATPAPAPATAGVRARRGTRRRAAIPATALAIAVFLGLVNESLQPYSVFGDVHGTATVAAFGGSQSVPRGWGLVELARFPWAGYYFTEPVSWVRYRLVLPRTWKAVIYADVIITVDRDSLNRQDAASSFLFRATSVRTWQRVDLGNGVYGQLLNYTDRLTKANWAAVSWVWPVLRGGQTLYERVILTEARNRLAQPPRGFTPAGGLHDIFLGMLSRAGGDRSNATVMRAYRQVDAALESAAQMMVSRAVARRG